MMKWDSRMHNTRSVQVLKVAIPFFDVSEGELIDVEGLLQAIHPLTCGRERKMMDSVMSFFQMRHMMDLFRMMRQVQKANEASGAEGTENPFEMLKMLMPEESQKDFEMISSMMEMMQAASVEQPEQAENDIFKTMHPVKLQVMKELAENMQGKSMKDAAPLLMAATTKLKNHNLSFSPEESKVLLEILTRNMSPQERAKVEMMKNVVARQQKK